MLALKVYVAVIVGSFLFMACVMARPSLAAWWYRIHDREVYPPEAAEAPSLDEHFNTAPMDDLDSSVDWHRYEYELRKQT